MALAFKKDWPESMADLLGRGYRVNTKDEVSGSTALHLTALANRPGNARVLLENKADRTIKNRQGLVAADLAWRKGYWTLGVYIECARRGLRAAPGARHHTPAISVSPSSPLPLQVSASRMRSTSSTRMGAGPSTWRKSRPSSRARAAATR